MAHLGFDLPQAELSNPGRQTAAGGFPAAAGAATRGERAMRWTRQWAVTMLAAAAAAISVAGPAQAQQKTLRAVMHSDLKILDPIWTTAYIVRNHGYMI